MLRFRATTPVAIPLIHQMLRETEGWKDRNGESKRNLSRKDTRNREREREGERERRMKSASENSTIFYPHRFVYYIQSLQSQTERRASRLNSPTHENEPTLLRISQASTTTRPTRPTPFRALTPFLYIFNPRLSLLFSFSCHFYVSPLIVYLSSYSQRPKCFKLVSIFLSSPQSFLTFSFTSNLI